MTQAIALYARVSSDKQAQEGTIESQIESLRAYARANGYRIEEDLIFIDEGISGTTLARPGLDALRDKAAGGEINKVLILCPDRLARKYAHQLILSELELHTLRTRLTAGLLNKAQRRDLALQLPVGLVRGIPSIHRG